jgi:hypothetical protein
MVHILDARVPNSAFGHLPWLDCTLSQPPRFATGDSAGSEMKLATTKSQQQPSKADRLVTQSVAIYDPQLPGAPTDGLVRKDLC